MTSSDESHPIVEPPEAPCSVVVLDKTPCGRVLKVELASAQTVETWAVVRAVLEQEIGHHRPQLLILDVRALQSIDGVPIIDALAAGAQTMRELGSDRQTTILATSGMAHDLGEALRRARFDALFDGFHPDLLAAVTACGPSR